MNQTLHGCRTITVVVAIASATTFTGCVARVRTGVVYSDPVVYVDTVPSYLYSQPYVYYRGYPAYWVDGRWYYQSAGGWVVFRREPAWLYQQRVRIHAQPQRRVYAQPRVHTQPRGRVYEQPRGRMYTQPRGRGHSDRHGRGRVVQRSDPRRSQ